MCQTVPSDRCCICKPAGKLTGKICYRHKAEAMRLSLVEGIGFTEACADLYLCARESANVSRQLARETS